MTNHIKSSNYDGFMEYGEITINCTSNSLDSLGSATDKTCMGSFFLWMFFWSSVVLVSSLFIIDELLTQGSILGPLLIIYIGFTSLNR